MQADTQPRTLPHRLLRAVTLLALSASVLTAAIGTLHWPIVGDAPLLHYTAFLLDHGKAPYTQIIEMDLPGTYAIEWTAIHALGPGPLAWRIADFLLIAFCWLSMIAITLTPNPWSRVTPTNGNRLTSWTPDWLPGFFSGALFALIHFRDGPTHTGQRDLMMTTMLLLGCAALFLALRKTSTTLSSRPKSAPFADAAERSASGTTPTVRPWLFTLFGLFLGIATTIKPTGAFFTLAFAAILWTHLHKLHRPKLKPFACATAGFLIPCLATAAWLHHHGSLIAFFNTMRGLSAYHASLGRPSLFKLLIGSFPSVLLAVAIPALPLFFTEKPWRHWQGQIILAGILLGCASYILQGKGFPYHRYPTEAFLLLLIGILAFAALQNTTWIRIPAVLTILLGALFLAPGSSAIACHYDWRNQEFNRSLAADLTTLSNGNLQTLQNRVQCLDNTAGCPNTLYNLQLVQATGYLYDCYMFQPKPSPYQDKYREDFLTALQQANPRILVASDQDCFTMNRSFSLLNRWPAFDDYLQHNYTLIAQRTPPHTVGWWRHPAQPFSYRIYLRKPQ